MNRFRKAVILTIAMAMLFVSTIAMAASVLEETQQDGKIAKEDEVHKKSTEKCKEHCGHRGKEGMVIKVYAEMTNRSAEDVKKACDASKLTIWQLAKREGKLDELKTTIIEKKTARLDMLVKEGKISQQKRDEKLKRLQDMLDQKS